ncbi:acetate/propionate family kinase [soil metagenome]
MSSPDLILVLNCGSSSIKFAVFDAAQARPSRTALWRDKVEGIGPAMTAHAALADVRRRVDDWLDGRRIVVVAHRVVHGGTRFHQPTVIDREVLADLRRLIPLAPLHQPFALDAIETMLADAPDLLQVACFDTAFHHDMPAVERMLPLPRSLRADELRRYGFHGLSYAFMAVALEERYGERANGRTLVAHLGSGASLCALHDLKSVATTMGFSALDGIMMGTRSGAIDPGVLLYLMEVEHLTPGEVGHLLYHDSGLLGVSGLSADPRELLAREADHDGARDALALYVRRIVHEAGALIAVLGGLDLLVFTAGIGEHSAELRRRICAAFSFMGIRIDDAANRNDAPVISRADSSITVGVEPTDEEWIAARDVLDLQAHLPKNRP